MFFVKMCCVLIAFWFVILLLSALSKPLFVIVITSGILTVIWKGFKSSGLKDVMDWVAR